jgi:thioredoxin 1
MEPSRLEELKDANFHQEVMHSPVPVVVEFWSPECSFCRKMEKVLGKLADEYGGLLRVVKVNVLENPVTSSVFGVGGVPAFFYIVGGTISGQTTGAKSKGRLKRELGLEI